MSTPTNQFLGLDHYPEDRFKQVYESNMVGILFWDMQGHIVEANDKLLNMIGYTRSELLRGELNWSKITPPEYAFLDEKCCELLMVGIDSVPYEKQYFHKDGHRIDILISNAMVKNSKEVGMACILDISTQKQAEQALAEHALQLVQSNKDLEQFATIIANDFQNPLRKLSSFAQHIDSNAQNTLEPDTVDDIKRILRLTKKMQTQCQNLLELSRVSQTGAIYEVLELSKIAKEALLDLHYTLKEYGARVRLEEMTDVQADPSQLKFLLVSVIETILQLSLEYGLLEMSISAVKQDNGYCELRFIQNVPDLSQEVFESPYAVGTCQKRDGFNIDAAIIKKIIDRHKGYVKVSQLPENLSEVVIGLPSRLSAMTSATRSRP